MKIKCIKNILTKDEIILHGLGSPDWPKFDFTIGEEYEVYGVAVYLYNKESRLGSSIEYLLDQGNWEYSGFFEVIDPTIPSDWIITDRFDDTVSLSLLMGPRDIFGENPSRAVVEMIEGGDAYRIALPKYIQKREAEYKLTDAHKEDMERKRQEYREKGWEFTEEY